MVADDWVCRMKEYTPEVIRNLVEQEAMDYYSKFGEPDKVWWVLNTGGPRVEEGRLFVVLSFLWVVDDNFFFWLL
jgi:hypothetical protein